MAQALYSIGGDFGRRSSGYGGEEYSQDQEYAIPSSSESSCGARRLRGGKEHSGLTEEQMQALQVQERVAGALAAVSHLVVKGLIDAAKKTEALEEVSQLFDVSLRSAQRSAKRLRETGSAGRKQGSGRPALFDEDVHGEWIMETHRKSKYSLSQDALLTQFCDKFGFGSTGLISKFMARDDLWKTRRLGSKPLLTEAHMKARLDFAMTHWHATWERHIDVDEKWFVSWSPRTVRMPKKQGTPTQPLQSKTMVTKVMVLCAVANPKPGSTEPGNVGIWRVADEMPSARRTSRLMKGEWRAIDQTMDKERFRKMLLENVIPAGRNYYGGSAPIVFQMDNARPHGSYDPSFLSSIQDAANKQPGPKVMLIYQPAQSPDTNACDLGILRRLHMAARSLRTQEDESEPPESVDEGGRVGSEDRDSEDEVATETPPTPPIDAVCGRSKFRRTSARAGSCPFCKEDGAPPECVRWITCKVRGTSYHVHCLRAKGMEVPRTSKGQASWACRDCLSCGCKFPRFDRNRCIRCNSKDCSLCSTPEGKGVVRAASSAPSSQSPENVVRESANADDAEAECEHWIRCDLRGGRFHRDCLTDDEKQRLDTDESIDDLGRWTCPVCEKAHPLEEPPSGFVRTWDGEVEFVDKENMYKYTTVWGSSKDNIWKAVVAAYNTMPADTARRIFETKTQVMRKIVEHEGGNFKMFHYRGKDKQST